MDCYLTKCLDPLVKGGCLALFLSLICEVNIVLVCALSLSVEVVIVGERSCVLSNCICPKSSVEVPCVGSPMWTS